MHPHPKIIQGGMGAAVSWWHLARTVSMLGQLGVVSGTGLDVVMVRRLQDGDRGGHIKRALDHFPFPKMAQRAWEKYFVPGGRAKSAPYKLTLMHSIDSPREVKELCIMGNFVEVFLAREGHDYPVGINYLEKLQMPHLSSIYGAMLAGVDYILMGAGIPNKIPGVLDNYVNHKEATYPISVVGGTDAISRFDPKEFMECELPPLKRPFFIPIIASNALAATMLRRSNGRIDGFVIEGPTAGGHNAPPRGSRILNEFGELVYGERDIVDLKLISELGLPFWVAGGFASAEKLRTILEIGGTGIQAGTAFAVCEESGLSPEHKRTLLEKSISGDARVLTDASASPTGYPFKVAQLEGTLSEKNVYGARRRVCDLGLLRTAYRKTDGSIGYRCPAEPVDAYVSKGGDEKDTACKKCLCNALLANIGMPQVRSEGYVEKSLVTCGNDVVNAHKFLPSGKTTYTARDVILKILAG